MLTTTLNTWNFATFVGWKTTPKIEVELDSNKVEFRVDSVEDVCGDWVVVEDVGNEVSDWVVDEDVNIDVITLQWYLWQGLRGDLSKTSQLGG